MWWTTLFERALGFSLRKKKSPLLTLDSQPPDIDECLNNSHNCVAGQVCINTRGSFYCRREKHCRKGYELWDDNSCHGISLTVPKKIFEHQKHDFCSKQLFSFALDINECALGTHNCGPDFVCNNTQGSFLCLLSDKCQGGFISDDVGSCIGEHKPFIVINFCT